MRKRLNWSILLVTGAALWSTVAHAEPFYFPIDGARNSQESISTQEGTVCTQNVNGRTSLNMGVYGTKRTTSSNTNAFYSQAGDNLGGFVMLTVPLNAPSRLNCSKLLEIEYERAKMRLEQEKLELLQPTEQETLNPMYH